MWEVGMEGGMDHCLITGTYFRFSKRLKDFQKYLTWIILANNNWFQKILWNIESVINEEYLPDRFQMTKWIWPNHDNDEPKQLNVPEIETNKP